MSYISSAVILKGRFLWIRKSTSMSENLAGRGDCSQTNACTTKFNRPPYLTNNTRLTSGGKRTYSAPGIAKISKHFQRADKLQMHACGGRHTFALAFPAAAIAMLCECKVRGYTKECPDKRSATSRICQHSTRDGLDGDVTALSKF